MQKRHTRKAILAINGNSSDFRTGVLAQKKSQFTFCKLKFMMYKRKRLIISFACVFLPIALIGTPVSSSIGPTEVGLVEIGWPSMTGELYRVQYSTNLLSANWSYAGNFMMLLGNGWDQSIVHTVNVHDVSGFFRVDVLDIPNNPFKVDQLDIAGFSFTRYTSGGKRIFHNSTLDISLQFSSPSAGRFQYSLHDGECPDTDMDCSYEITRTGIQTVENLLTAPHEEIRVRSVGIFGDPRYNGDKVLNFGSEHFNRYTHHNTMAQSNIRFRNLDLGVAIWFNRMSSGGSNIWSYTVYSGDWVVGTPPSNLAPYKRLMASGTYSTAGVFFSLKQIDTWIKENADFLPLNTPQYDTLMYGNIEFVRSDDRQIPTFFQWSNDYFGAIIEITGQVEGCGGCWMGGIQAGGRTNQLTSGANARELAAQLESAVLDMLAHFTHGDPWDERGVMFVNGIRYEIFNDSGYYGAYNRVYYSTETGLTLDFWAKHRRHNASVFLGRGRLEKTVYFAIIGQYPNNQEGTVELLDELSGDIAAIARVRMRPDDNFEANETDLRFSDALGNQRSDADNNDVLVFKGEPFEIRAVYPIHCETQFIGPFNPVTVCTERMILETSLGEAVSASQNPLFYVYKRPGTD